MKPSQRIYQQRDIAKYKMDRYAGYIAEQSLVIPKNERQTKTHEALLKSHKDTYRKWRTITEVLTVQGGIASSEEHQERKKKKQQHEENKAKEVVEEAKKEDTRDKSLVNPFSDYVQKQLDTYFASTTTNTVTLNTNFPFATSTTGMTYKFTIPKFDYEKKIVEEEVEGYV